MIEPIIMNRDDVQNRGEELSAIWWQGRQWAVTEYGIEARDGTYHFQASRLSEKRTMGRHEGLPNWPIHVCEKTWVYANDFCSAFLIALVLHGHGAAFTPEELRAACAEAIRKKDGDDDLSLKEN